MAWIVGLATDEEIGALRDRGWTVEEPSPPVREALAAQEKEDAQGSTVQAVAGVHLCSVCRRQTMMRAVQIYVDTDLFKIMSGSEWSTEPDHCASGDMLASRLHGHPAPALHSSPRAMNKQLIVQRDSRDETTFAVINYAGCERGQLLACLREAIGLWAQHADGQAAMEDASGDFNVGDLSNYTPAGEAYLHDPLSACLAKAGITYLNIEVYSQDGPAPRWSFDTLLG